MKNMLSKLLIAAALSPAVNTFAGVFVITDDAQPASKGDLEFHLNMESAIGKHHGENYEYGLAGEFAYGATETLEVSLSIDMGGIHSRPNHESNYEHQGDFNLTGLSLGLKNQILDPEAENAVLGLAVVASTSMAWADVDGSGLHEYGFNLGLNFQKNFCDGDLIVALTPSIGFASAHENSDSEWENSITYSVGTGVSYTICDGWRVGIEAVYEANYSGEFDGARFYAGPNVCYEAEKWWFTLAVLPQIIANADELHNNIDLEGGSHVSVAAQIGFVF